MCWEANSRPETAPGWWYVGSSRFCWFVSKWCCDLISYLIGSPKEVTVSQHDDDRTERPAWVPPPPETEMVAVEAEQVPNGYLGQAQDHSGARTDRELVELWLGTKRSEHTQRAYGRDVEGWLVYLRGFGRGLRGATAADLQRWASSLEGAPASRARRISAVKSLLTFGHKTGFLVFNVGSVVSGPSAPNELAERILTEVEVHQLLKVAKGRDRALLIFLYLSGARISEALVLQWRHVHPSPDGTASITLHGKGDKTRHVRLPDDGLRALETVRPADCAPERCVFSTASGRPLDDANVRRTLRALAKRAELALPVSPHWMRHAHASHALDRGAPIHLVQATLGHGNVATTGRYLHAKPGESSGGYLRVSD